MSSSISEFSANGVLAVTTLNDDPLSNIDADNSSPKTELPSNLITQVQQDTSIKALKNPTLEAAKRRVEKLEGEVICMY